MESTHEITGESIPLAVVVPLATPLLVRSFPEIVDECQRQVFSYFLRAVGNWHDAEDLCQKCLMNAHKGWKTFDQTRKALPWLFTIAGRTLATEFRRNRIKTVPLDAASETELDNDAECEPADPRELAPPERAIQRERISAVLEARSRLSDPERELFDYHLSGLSNVEIAAETGKSALAIGSALQRLHGKLERMRSIKVHKPEDV